MFSISSRKDSEPTYGIRGLQEQVMQAASEMADLLLNDILRRATGRRIRCAIAAQKKICKGPFSKGSINKKMLRRFMTIESLPTMGFNKYTRSLMRCCLSTK